MCSRPLYMSEEDRILDPYRAYILELYFWWEAIEFEFKEMALGLVMWLTTRPSIRIKNFSFLINCVLFVLLFRNKISVCRPG